MYSVLSDGSWIVKVVYPLKQGLKPSIDREGFDFDGVKVVYPLKQGLKQLTSGYLFNIPLIR